MFPIIHKKKKITNYVKHFDYLIFYHEALLSSHPYNEVFHTTDFNVHDRDWLGSNQDDHRIEKPFSFPSIMNRINQLNTLLNMGLQNFTTTLPTHSI